MSATDGRPTNAGRDPHDPATVLATVIPAPAPPAWRDPWAWVSVLAVVPLVLHSLGAPLGEPVADDFDYFRRALFGPHGSFFDGYGSPLYWRPLGRQIYFGLLAPSILAHPVLVPIIHGACLALIGLILYLSFRVRWSGPLAAAMATFVLLMESTRMLLAIPTYAEELGALLFASLALHEAAHRRMVTALAAMLGSLLGKEIGMTTAILLPWMPPALAHGRGLRGRLAWSAAAVGMLMIWGAVYLAACRAHGMKLPHDLESATLATPWLTRYAWACWNSARAMFSLAPDPGAWDGLILIPLAALLVAIGARFAVDRAARARLAGAMPWIAWGAAWYLAASAALTEVFPSWSPNRAVFAGVGFGVAITAIIGAAHPALAACLVALRLFAFAVSAGPPPAVTAAPIETGATDFTYLVRLQRHVRDTRSLLRARFPTLPHGARVGLLRPPLMTEYAYRSSLGLQLWYRDTSLRMVRYLEFREHPEWELSAIVEFHEDGNPQLVLVSPVSMRHYLLAGRLVQREAWQAAHDELALAESLQIDRGARAFLGRVAGRRALCWLGLGRPPEAEREARRSLALAPEGSDARYTLASVMAFSGRRPQARAQLDTLLKLDPGDRSARALRDSLRSWLAREP